MARRTKEEAEETKKAICLAALDIFCEKGYSRTTFDEIAKRINLTKGAIYWHFRNKADILTEIIRKGFTISQSLLSVNLSQVNSIYDLKEHILSEVKLIQENKIYKKFLFFVIFQMEWSEAILNKVGSEIQDIIQSGEEIRKAALRKSQASGEISDSIDIEELSWILGSLHHGMIKNIISNNYSGDAFQLVSSGFDLIIKGSQTKG